MSRWTVGTTTDDDNLIDELSDRVRHEAYAVDPHAVAGAVLREVADSWTAFTQGRVHGLGVPDPRSRRRSM